jgi:hypothetical protein
LIRSILQEEREKILLQSYVIRTKGGHFFHSRGNLARLIGMVTPNRTLTLCRQPLTISHGSVT